MTARPLVNLRASMVLNRGVFMNYADVRVSRR